MSKKLYFLISFVLVLGLNGTALADAIEVNNPSFEHDINGVAITELTGWDGVKGWDIRDTSGEGDGWYKGWQFVDDEWEHAEGYEAADGNVSSFNVTADEPDDPNWSCQIYQVLDPNLDADSTIVANRRYTLRFNAIRMGTEDTPTVYGALFYSVGGVNVSAANDVILSEKEVVLTAPPLWDAGYAGWEEISLYYVALPSASSLGERLGVKLSVPVHEPWLYGYQVMLDNVRVDWVLAVQAYDPFPDDEARDVAKNVTLGWKPGVKVQPTAGHEVYFGTDETAVEDANTSDTTGILYHATRDVNNYTVPSTLVLGETYYWRVDEVNSLEGGSPWKGEVWSFRATGYATNPSPYDGEIDVPFLNQSLMWTAGTDATSHDVYLGTDVDAVADANTNSAEFKQNQVVGDTDYPLTGLMAGETYYWRIDERSAVYPSGLKGDIWKFTVGNFLIADNFESYANNSELYTVWDDYWANGYDGEMFLETDPLITRERLSQAAELKFTNVTADKGAQKGSMFDVQDLTELEIGTDWTIGGVKSLFLYVRGDPCNVQAVDDGKGNPLWEGAQPWIELEDTSNNTGYVLHPNPGQMGDEWWREWNIDLGDANFSGVTLSAIDRFTIGIGGAAKAGQKTAMADAGYIWVDDIRLYPPRCRTDVAGEPYFNSKGDFSGPDGTIDCTVDEYDLEVMGAEWLVSDYNTLAAPPADPPEVWYRFDDDPCLTILTNSGSWGSQYDISIDYPPASDEPAWTTDVAPAVDVCDPNYALDFDGTDDVLEIPNSPATNFAGTENMTITVWIKTTTAAWDAWVCSARGSGDRHATGIGTMGANEFGYFWNENEWWWDSGLTITDNQWTFTAVAVEPTQATAYVYNGTTLNKNTNVTTHGPLEEFGTDDLTVIASDARDYRFDGTIDDVRLYNKTLTICEIMGIAGISGEVYVPNQSKANIAPKTPPPTNPDPNDPDIVNFVDYEVLAGNWLEQFLWP
ncbi:MAG: LamG domain-containing protein [Planctomycetota bacterium]|nr:MAG: LamG domain-containing protein [Planctomycetota bacterium]